MSKHRKPTDPFVIIAWIAGVMPFTCIIPFIN